MPRCQSWSQYKHAVVNINFNNQNYLTGKSLSGKSRKDARKKSGKSFGVRWLSGICPDEEGSQLPLEESEGHCCTSGHSFFAV